MKRQFFILKPTGRPNEYVVDNPFDKQPFKLRYL
jgi:hypothetical protein